MALLPPRPYPKQGKALSGRRGHEEAPTRIHLRLVFRRKKNRQILLDVGGTWDQAGRRYVDDGAHPAREHTVWVNESQVAMVEATRSWIKARLARQARALILFAGTKRGGGKTWITVALLAAIGLALAGAITYVVSPTFDKRDEIERYLRGHIPGPWRLYNARALRFLLANGSMLKSLSGDVEGSTKRGDADAVLLNEAQDMALSTYALALGSLRTGGVMIIATNAPTRRRGEWVYEVRERILDGTIAGEVIELDPELNEDIDHATMSQIDVAIRVVSERIADADMGGIWRPVDDRAYSHYRPRKNDRGVATIGKVPEVGDVTAQVLKRLTGRPFEYLCGADFQIHPGNALVALKAFGDPARPIWYPVLEYLIPDHEDYLLDEIDDDGELLPENCIIIGDASGDWQDAAHRTRGRVSFDVFRQRRWRIEPPQKKKTEKGEHARNPDREDRVALVNRGLDQGWLLIDPERTPKLAEDFARCEWKVDRPVGRHAHRTDGVGYALWWAEPKPRAKRRAGGAGSVKAPQTEGNWH